MQVRALRGEQARVAERVRVAAQGAARLGAAEGGRGLREDQ